MTPDSLVQVVGATTSLVVGTIVIGIAVLVAALFVCNIVLLLVTGVVEYIKGLAHPGVWVVVDVSEDGETRDIQCYRREPQARKDCQNGDRRSLHQVPPTLGPDTLGA